MRRTTRLIGLVAVLLMVAPAGGAERNPFEAKPRPRETAQERQERNLVDKAAGVTQRINASYQTELHEPPPPVPDTPSIATMPVAGANGAKGEKEAPPRFVAKVNGRVVEFDAERSIYVMRAGEQDGTDENGGEQDGAVADE